MNMYYYVFVKIVSQCVRAFLIGTLPYFLARAMGYEIVYWHFLVIAYAVDVFSQLTTDGAKEFAKWAKNNYSEVKTHDQP